MPSPPLIIIGVARGGGGGGGCCCSSYETSRGGPLLRERRRLPALPNSVRRAAHDGSAVEACGPGYCVRTSATYMFFFVLRLLALLHCEDFRCAIMSVVHVVVYC